MGVGVWRGGARGGAGERKLMVAQECGEKSRIETRLDFGGPLRSFFWDYVPLKRPFTNRSLNTLIRSNPTKTFHFFLAPFSNALLAQRKKEK